MSEEAKQPEFSLNNPPLVCVVVKMLFTTKITKIAKYVEELQDELRLKGFDYYEAKKNVHSIQIDQKSDKETKVAFRQANQWQIANIEGKISLRIEEDSISILFGKYVKFEEAKILYKELLEAIEKHVVGIQCREIQMRYINYIDVSEHSADLLVQKFVLGMPNLSGLKRSASVSETVFKSSINGQLVVRCSYMPRGLTLPPDLLPMEIPTNLMKNSKTPFLLLENLHALNTGNESFNADNFLSRLETMRADIHQAFTETTTEKARELWK